MVGDTQGIVYNSRLLGYEIEPWLSRSRVKRQIYGVDLYFREGWEDICEAIPSPEERRNLLQTHSLLVLKPDAVVGRSIRNALAWLARHGVEVVSCETCVVGTHATKALWTYQWNTATRDRRTLLELLFSMTDSLVLTVRLPADLSSASERMSSMKGSATPSLRESWHLRSALNARNHVLNSVHTCDESADMIRELAVFLDAGARRRSILSMLSGIPASTEAKVDSLYKSAPERDLSFEASHRRWLQDARRVGSDVAYDTLSHIPDSDGDWRGIALIARSSGMTWDGWDTIVLGARLLRSSLPVLQRIIDSPPSPREMDLPS